MVRLPESHRDEAKNSVDAYLDAFVSGEMSNHSFSSEAFKSEHAQEEPASSASTWESPTQVADGIQNFNRFAAAEKDIQHLQRFLSESHAKGKKPRVKRKARLLKGVVLALGLSISAVALYQYLIRCSYRGTCLWASLKNTQNALTLGDEQKTSLPTATQLTGSTITTPNPFREAVNKATNAVRLGEIAATEEEWDKVVDEWLSAIRLMQSIPKSSPRYELAQEKVREYIGYLSSVRQQAKIYRNQHQEHSEEKPDYGLCYSTPGSDD